jgi:hypothetical protein
MNNRTTIQDELKELSSQLPMEKGAELYTVPQGYFENFSASMLQKLGLENTPTSVEELEHLSPMLAGIPKKMPFTVPEGYFNNTTEGLNEWVKDEETPQFAKVGKQMPYTVPAGYFENLAETLLKKVSPREARVIPISSSRKWMRYAVAAMVAGIITISSVLYFGKDRSVDPMADSYSWLEKNLKNVPDNELDEFLSITYISNNAIAKTETGYQTEVRKLVKDIPDKELDKFLEEVTIEDASLFN